MDINLLTSFFYFLILPSVKQLVFWPILYTCYHCSKDGNEVEDVKLEENSV